MIPVRCISVVAVGIMLLAACGGSQSDATAPQTLAVVAKEFVFAPAALTVRAGQPVTIALQNNGTLQHDWSVREIEISGEAKSSGDPHAGHVMGDMSNMPKLHVAAGIGGKSTLTFTPNKPGTYEFYCTVAGHKDAGMVGTLLVTG
jgi:uncharacterized cupredoxin-like copper-binding protein